MRNHFLGPLLLVMAAGCALSHRNHDSTSSSAVGTYALGYNYVAPHHSAFSILGTAGSTTGGVGARLPAAVDNTGYNPPVGNQGAIGSCVAWATAYGAGGYLAKKSGAGALLFAPMYIYNQASLGCANCGMEVDQAFGFMQSGVELAQAYDTASQFFPDEGASVPGLGDDRSANFLGNPSPSDLQAALAQKLVNYQRIFDAPPSTTSCAGASGATAAIQVALQQALPVVIALPVYPEFESYDGVHPVLPPAAGESPLGGHAMLCTKYDANGLVCQNSWGATWGQSGSVELGWSFVEQCLYEAEITTQLVVNAQNVPAVVPTIKSPATGSTLHGTVTFDVGFAAPAGANPIQSIQLQQVNGNTLVDASPNASGGDYTVTLDTTQLAMGWIPVVAVLEDTAGNQFQSPVEELNIYNTVPVISSPAPGARILDGTTIVSGVVAGLTDPTPSYEWFPGETFTPCATITITVDGQPVGNAGFGGFPQQTFTLAITNNATLAAGGPHTIGATCVAQTTGIVTQGPGVPVVAPVGVTITAPAAGAAATGQVPLSVTTSEGSNTSAVVDAVVVTVASMNCGQSCAGTTLATFSGPRGSTTWDTTALADGSYTLTATATDSTGNTGTATLGVAVQNHPTIVVGGIGASFPNAAYPFLTGLTSVTSAAQEEGPNEQAIQSFAFAVDGTVFATGQSPSITWDTTMVSNGTHTLSVTATDAAGNTGSSSRSVTIYNTSMTSPAPGATVSGQVALILDASFAGTATSYSPDSALDAFFYVTPVGQPQGSFPAADIALSTGVYWQSTSVPNGTYVVTPALTDSLGNKYGGKSIQITVSN